MLFPKLAPFNILPLYLLFDPNAEPPTLLMRPLCSPTRPPKASLALPILSAKLVTPVFSCSTPKAGSPHVTPHVVLLDPQS